MKPAAFEYHAPESVADVASLLAEHGDDAKVLAGGQSLVPLLAMRLTRFPHIVDLNRVAELDGITQQNGTLTINAMTRQATAEHDATVAAAAPLVAAALPLIGHFQIRNRGTVGGSIAHADPASELPAVALALDAEIEAARQGSSRRIPAADFFDGTWTTTLDPEEIVTAIHFPVWTGTTGFVVDEIARRSGDFALTGVACGVELDGSGAVERSAIGLFGMGPTPIRPRDAEAALNGSTPSEADLTEIGRIASAACNPTDDVHASAEYRTHVGAHLVQRALKRALGDASGG
ncbi:MAG TPA: xanthine dehydrogenase family protein subunit M [Acidimicrobiia bacterium]|nr:xanthine dehydrogenase family protein subunit M [Acidimicrobiia bacterium]